jgi:hypothetical protein
MPLLPTVIKGEAPSMVSIAAVHADIPMHTPGAIGISHGVSLPGRDELEPHMALPSSGEVDSASAMDAICRDSLMTLGALISCAMLDPLSTHAAVPPLSESWSRST